MRTFLGLINPDKPDFTVLRTVHYHNIYACNVILDAYVIN